MDSCSKIAMLADLFEDLLRCFAEAIDYIISEPAQLNTLFGQESFERFAVPGIVLGVDGIIGLRCRCL